MEFTRRAGDVRDEFAIGYFADHALRAEICTGNSGLVSPMMSRREALMEELRREQMREHMLAREIAQKRMVENEIRRELEFERRIAMSRFEEERFLPMEMESGVEFGGRLGHRGFVASPETRVGFGESLGHREFMPSPDRWFGFGERLGHHGFRPSPVMPQFEDVRVDERPVSHYREVEAFKRPTINPRLEAEFSGYKDDEFAPSPLMPHFNDIRVDEGLTDHYREVTAYERSSVWPESFDGEEGLVMPRLKAEFSGYNKKKPSKHQALSGAKRKRSTEFSQPRPSKKCQCPLCQVTATSQKNLNVHLHGKKHQAKQAEVDLKAKENATKHQAMSSSSKKPSKNDNEEKMQLGGKLPNHVWCKLCNLKCNSPAMLESHLKGKKHKAQLEGKEITVSKGKRKCEDGR